MCLRSGLLPHASSPANHLWVCILFASTICGILFCDQLLIVSRSPAWHSATTRSWRAYALGISTASNHYISAIVAFLLFAYALWMYASMSGLPPGQVHGCVRNTPLKLSDMLLRPSLATAAFVCRRERVVTMSLMLCSCTLPLA